MSACEFKREDICKCPEEENDDNNNKNEILKKQENESPENEENVNEDETEAEGNDNEEDDDDDNGKGDGGFKFQTAPFDPRFPNQNQTKHCYSSFLDYHKCIRLRGEDFEPCQYYKKVYTSMCPNSWVEKWEDQIERGAFPHPLDPKPKDDNKSSESESENSSGKGEEKKKCKK